MKKNILWLAAATLLLMACNNDKQENPEENGAVRVEIGSSSPAIEITKATRASINDWANTQEVGLFAISKNASDWSSAINDIYLIDNLKVQIGDEGDDYPIIFDTQVFYPISKTHAYSFYGYYPYQDEAAINRTTNYVTCEFTLTGAEDLIWGIASSNAEGAYNGAYIRNNGTPPSMEFKHLLTRFTFNIKDGNDSEGAGKMTINSVKIKEVENTVNLYLANRINSNLPGTFQNTDGSTDFVLRAANGPFNPVDIPTTLTRIGESIMVIPGEDTYTIEIELGTEGSDQTNTMSMEFSHPTGVFEAGVSHQINMTVFGPNEVTITTSLEPWDNTGAPIDVEFE